MPLVLDAQTISNKNSFYKFCCDLNIPTLETYVCDQTSDVERLIDTLQGRWPYIIKPAADRLAVEDQRRNFSVVRSRSDAVNALNDSERILPPFQIQEYIDFTESIVSFYNVTFLLSNIIKHYLTTEQLINLSAIHNNKNSLHWGNRSIRSQSNVTDGEKHAMRLAHFYFDNGYRGDIGIDFGIAQGRLFFLETNARVNNGTRIYHELQNRNHNFPGSHYMQLRTPLLERYLDVTDKNALEGDDVVVIPMDGERTLILSKYEGAINDIHHHIDRLAKAKIPVEL